MINVGQLIFGFILLIIGLAIVAIVMDGIEKKFQYQIDNLKKENKHLRQKIFELEIRK
jgi:demethoxyubiquinone hydroxylase (CLK1/Coq7/Cat5 family)